MTNFFHFLFVWSCQNKKIETSFPVHPQIDILLLSLFYNKSTFFTLFFIITNPEIVTPRITRRKMIVPNRRIVLDDSFATFLATPSGNVGWCVGTKTVFRLFASSLFVHVSPLTLTNKVHAEMGIDELCEKKIHRWINQTSRHKTRRQRTVQWSQMWNTNYFS